MELHTLSLREIQDLIVSKKITAEEVYNYFLKRTNELQPSLNVFSTLPSAFDTASLSSSGELLVPIAIKDVFCEKGVPTTACSNMLKDFIPPYESTVTDRLKKAGYISFGKTNMDEFAMGGSGENSAFGPAKNPWDSTRIPGGSSSGSAVAVAAGLVPAALGTDTGGSIRQPASMCGIVGFKPTYGRNPRTGVIAMASSLDCPGYFTRTVRDAALLYEITTGHDSADMTSLNLPSTVHPEIWDKSDFTGIRVGVPEEYFAKGLSDSVNTVIQDVIAKIGNNGGTIVPISLPHTKEGIAVYYIISPAEVASNMARYDGIRFGAKIDEGYDVTKTRSKLLGAEVQRRSMLGSFVLSSGFYDAYYKKATSMRELIRDDFIQAFSQVDVIVAPTAPNVARKIGEVSTDPMEAYMEDVFTVPASLAGIPGISVPVGFASPADDTTKLLPVGMQIFGAHYHEETVFQVAALVEKMQQEIVRSQSAEIG